MRTLELLFNALWLVLGLGICAISFKLGLFGPFGPDSGFFPLLAGGSMAGGAALMLARRDSGRRDEEPFFPSGASPRRVVVALAIMAAMIAALPWIGFILIGIVGMPLLLRTIGTPSWIFAALFGMTSTATVYVIFDRLLGMPLPRGPLGI
jgi:hypothetical protein